MLCFLPNIWVLYQRHRIYKVANKVALRLQKQVLHHLHNTFT
jgi:hypothetical protein